MSLGPIGLNCAPKSSMTASIDEAASAMAPCHHAGGYLERKKAIVASQCLQHARVQTVPLPSPSLTDGIGFPFQVRTIRSPDLAPACLTAA